MKIQVEHYKRKITIEAPDDVGIDELHYMWEAILVAMSYPTQAVVDYYKNINKE